jgi:hypothetical protein
MSAWQEPTNRDLAELQPRPSAGEVVRGEGEPADQQDDRDEEEDDPEDRDQRRLAALAGPFDLEQVLGLGLDLPDRVAQEGIRFPVEVTVREWRRFCPLSSANRKRRAQCDAPANRLRAG